MYGMYTQAGDNAVEAVVSEYLKRPTPIKKSEIWDLIKEISDRVKEMGKEESNPGKHDGDLIRGFNEVSDTVVRDNIYCTLMNVAVDD